MNTLSQSYQRINITIPQRTLELLDRIAERGDRSRVVAEAVEKYVSDVGARNLRERLKEGAIARAERDLLLAEEWFPFDEEIVQKK